MTGLPQFDARTSTELLKVLVSMPEKATVLLDPNNGVHRNVIAWMLDACGKTPARYPALHAALGSAEPTSTAAPRVADSDKAVVVAMGYGAGGKAAAEAWHGSQAPAWLSGGSTLLIDADDGALLAFGTMTRVGYAFSPVRTALATALPARPAMTAVRFFHSQANPNAPVRFGLMKETRQGLDIVQQTTVNVTDPVAEAGHNQSRVTIGLMRDSTQVTDSDYYYTQDTRPTSDETYTPRLMVPLVGTIEFPNSIDTSDGMIAESLIFYEAGTFVGTMTSYDILGTNNDGSAKVTASSSTLTLNYPYHLDDAPTLANPSALVYGKTTEAVWDPGGGSDISQAYFFYSITALLQQPPPARVTVSVYSSSIPGTAPPAPSAQIPYLHFRWHCLAAGTQVTLADGSQRLIDTLTQADTLRTDNHGGTLPVEATMIGGFDGKIHRLVTDGGHSLISSEFHPIATPHGLVFARDLKAGDEVVVLGGTARVAGNTLEPFRGMLHNVTVGDFKLRQRPLAARGTTFFANGILVGDLETTHALYAEQMTKLAYMLDRLPATHHTDLRSAFEDIASQTQLSAIEHGSDA